MAKYINLEDAIMELRKSHGIGEAHRRLLQMETINIVQCQDCKKNPKDTWFDCPMSHLTEKQRPETAWCWKGEENG